MRLAADQLCNPLIGKTGTEVELQHPFSAPEGIAGVTEVGERERSLLDGIVAGPALPPLILIADEAPLANPEEAVGNDPAVKDFQLLLPHRNAKAAVLAQHDLGSWLGVEGVHSVVHSQGLRRFVRFAARILGDFRVRRFQQANVAIVAFA